MVIIPYIMPPLPLAMVKIHRWTSGSLLVAEQCIHTYSHQFRGVVAISVRTLPKTTNSRSLVCGMATGRVKEASELVEGLLVLLFENTIG